MGDTRAQLAWKSFSELELVWPSWLVHGLLPREGLICLYGWRGSGKTFLALDLALSIAAGTDDWNGLPVAAGRVAYLLAERPDGLKRRILGWGQHRGLTPAQLQERLDGKDSRFVAAGGMVALNEERQRRELHRTLDGIGDISLLVVDPLASFNSGLENDARDMQRFVAGVREIVEIRKCAVLLVHHAGKANGQRPGAPREEALDRGARGSSALEAAMDTVLSLRTSGGHKQLEVTKQREHRALAPFTMTFDAVTDDAGNELGQYPVALQPVKSKDDGARKETRDKQYERILEAVDTLSADTEDGWVAIQAIIEATAQSLHVKAGRIRAVAEELKQRGRLEKGKAGTNVYFRRADHARDGDGARSPSPTS